MGLEKPTKRKLLWRQGVPADFKHWLFIHSHQNNMLYTVCTKTECFRARERYREQDYSQVVIGWFMRPETGKWVVLRVKRMCGKRRDSARVFFSLRKPVRQRRGARMKAALPVLESERTRAGARRSPLMCLALYSSTQSDKTHSATKPHSTSTTQSR